MTVACQPRLFGLPQQELTSDDYYTPAWVFERMGITFDLDVCAPPGGIEWIPAAHYFTQEDDGLAQPWTGRVWMNPPYSDCAPWIRRFIEHRNGVCLVQVSRAAHGAAMWDAADAIMFAGTFAFVEPLGFQRTHHGRPGEIFMPVWFAAFGDECVDAISNLGVVRRVA
jgi:hypothetical protein